MAIGQPDLHNFSLGFFSLILDYVKRQLKLTSTKKSRSWTLRAWSFEGVVVTILADPLEATGHPVPPVPFLPCVESYILTVLSAHIGLHHCRNTHLEPTIGHVCFPSGLHTDLARFASYPHARHVVDKFKVLPGHCHFWLTFEYMVGWWPLFISFMNILHVPVGVY